MYIDDKLDIIDFQKVTDLIEFFFYTNYKQLCNEELTRPKGFGTHHIEATVPSPWFVLEGAEKEDKY